ncbi:MAG: ADP-ribosylation factor-like protein [Candidatus Hodarchaeales archaeon]|jgi:small GTP-binding protein
MGIFSRLFRRKSDPIEGNVAFIGLSFAGKTTILTRLRTEEFKEDTLRTMGLNVDSFEFKGVKFSAFDLGGQETFRMIWEPYLKNALAVVYVIDSSTPDLFNESAEVLHDCLNLIPKKATLLLLANKSDLAGENALSEILSEFHFKEMQEYANLKRINLFYISAKTGDQFDDAFEWLAESVADTVKIDIKTTKRHKKLADAIKKKELKQQMKIAKKDFIQM